MTLTQRERLLGRMWKEASEKEAWGISDVGKMWESAKPYLENPGVTKTALDGASAFNKMVGNTDEKNTPGAALDSAQAMAGKAGDWLKGFAGESPLSPLIPKEYKAYPPPTGSVPQPQNNTPTTPPVAWSSNLPPAVKNMNNGTASNLMGIKSWWDSNKGWALPVGVGVGGLMALMFMMNRNGNQQAAPQQYPAQPQPGQRRTVVV